MLARVALLLLVTPALALPSRKGVPEHPLLPDGPEHIASFAKRTRGTGPSLAIIVPVHPPKFSFAMDLLQSMVSCEQDKRFAIFFAFSNEEDKAEFLAIPDPPLVPQLLVLNGSRIAPQNPATTKKWLALDLVFRENPHIQYALATDCDQLFQSTKDFSSYFAEWAAHKMVLGSYYAHREFYPVMQDASCAAVGVDATPPHGMPYTWWADAPVYERADFADFFSRIQWDKVDAVEVFDHVSYQCYKLHVQGWQLVDSVPYTGSCKPLEKQSSHEQGNVSDATGYRFLWSRDENPDRLLQFHIDRPQFRTFVGCASQPPKRWTEVEADDAQQREYLEGRYSVSIARQGRCSRATDDIVAPAANATPAGAAGLHATRRGGREQQALPSECEAALLQPTPKTHLLTFSSEGPPYDSGRSAVADEAVYRQAMAPHVASYTSWTPRLLRDAGAEDFVQEWPDEEEVPQNPKTNKIGFFAWKPWIMLRKLGELPPYSAEAPDIVVYHDAYSSERHPNYIDKPEVLAPLSAYLLNGSHADVFMGIQKACPARHCKTLKQYCKTSVLEELGGGRRELYDYPLLQANYVVARNTPEAAELLQEWLDAVSNHDWLSPEPADLHPHPEFEWHSAEQCLFGVIAAKRVLDGKLGPRYPGFDGFNLVHKGAALDCSVPVPVPVADDGE